MTKTLKTLLLTLGFSALLVSGCQNNNQQPTEVTVEADIIIENYAYTPSSLIVSPGQMITVLNLDIPSHTVTSLTSGLFDTGLLGQNQSITITAPSEPGEYPFFCTPHPNMQGTLIVESQ